MRDSRASRPDSKIFFASSCIEVKTSNANVQRGTRVQTWAHWQREVIAVLRRDLPEALDYISMDDVDWSSWERFFLAGHSPQEAVDRALERDLS